MNEKYRAGVPRAGKGATLKERARVLWITGDPSRAFEKTGLSREELDEEPVSWCEHCGSLAVLDCDLPGVDCYCGKCHSTNISSGTIREWEARLAGDVDFFNP